MEAKETVIVGGGPAGLAVCLAAAGSGRFDALLAAGLVVVERSDTIGPGRLGEYAIRSDSLADSFLRFADAAAIDAFHPLMSHPDVRRLRARRGNSVPLELAADLMRAAADHLRAHAQASGHADVFRTRVSAQRGIRMRDGRWRVECVRTGGAGERFDLVARNLVLATGASHDDGLLSSSEVGGEPLLPRHHGKLVWSDTLLSMKGQTILQRRLAAIDSPRIVIVGGSHSAVASAVVILGSGLVRVPGAVRMLHRRTLRVTYATPDEARADGCADFGPADVCSRTGRVFPLAGFRAEARDFVRAQLSLGGLSPDPRAQFVDLRKTSDRAVQAMLEEADLIVAALGYRPHALPLQDEAGTDIPLLAASSPVAPLVDGGSRILDTVGEPVANVFAIGLSAGYPLSGRYGEPSFRGQANGLGLWQTDIGNEIVDMLLAYDELAHARAEVRACTG